MKSTLLKSIFFFSLAFAASSCLKNKVFDQKSQNATKDLALGENIFSDAFKQVGASGQATADSLGKSGNEMMAGCGTLTITPWDTVTWPKTVVLDFGPDNCFGSDFNQRRGKIICSFSYWFQQPGTVVTVNFDNYHVNDHKVEGTKVITNQGRNAAQKLVYNINFPNCVITKPNGAGIINWSTNRTHVWAEGEGTWTPFDDVWTITGSATAVSSDNVTCNFSTQTDLNVKFGCKWIRSGILDINIDGLSPITVNYGPGTCDANAVATYNGVEYPFVMQ